jgi:hypothetical protein
MKDQQGKMKKMFLSDEEKKNIRSRQGLLAEHNFYMHMLNNAIVEYLKQVVYVRLGLDVTKDYPLSNDGQYLILESEASEAKEVKEVKERKKNEK